MIPGIDLSLLPFSFVAGVMTFFNPCGVAMLPSYVSYYLGGKAGRGGPPIGRGWRGLTLGAVTSAGFFTVFSGVGLLLSAVGSTVARSIPWIAALMGLGLVVLGFLMLLGRGAPHLSLAKAAGLVSRGNPGEEGLSFYYLYGVGYAIASVGCALPIFMIVVTQAFTGGLLNGLVQFVAFSEGMTVMMIALSLAMAFSGEFIRRYLPAITKAVSKASALVLIGAGGYLVYYQLIYSRVLVR